MKTHRMFVLALALALTMGLVASAYAADTAAAPAAKAAKAPKAQKAAKPKVEVKCEVTGKLDAKVLPNKKNKNGKPVKVFTLAVSQAKGADGKAIDTLTGKTLNVNGKKGIKLSSYVGKEVTIAGTLVNNKRLMTETIK